MAPDDTVEMPEEPTEETPEVEVIEEELSGFSGRVVVDSLTATTSAIGGVSTGALDASTSMIGGVSAGGDVDLQMSAVGVILAKQNVDFRQGWVNNVLATGDVSVTQGGNAMMIGRSATLENAGSAVVLAGDAKVNRGWVGMVIAGKTEVSEDSRVFITTRAALIIAAALFGGLGLVALAMLFASGKVAKEWSPKQIGEWAKHKMPADWSAKHGTPAEWIERIRKAAAA
jgi:hypothetical protein